MAYKHYSMCSDRQAIATAIAADPHLSAEFDRQRHRRQAAAKSGDGGQATNCDSVCCEVVRETPPMSFVRAQVRLAQPSRPPCAQVQDAAPGFFPAVNTPEHPQQTSFATVECARYA